MNRGIAADRKASLIVRGRAFGYTTFEEEMMTKKESVQQKPPTREQVRHAKLRIEQIAERKVSALGKLNKWKGDAAARIIDELILGDAHEALAAIRAFESKVF